MSRPKILVTNDDGINSFFLKVLIEAFIERGCELYIAAPAKEQSWIGRAFSRWRTVSVERSILFDVPAWVIDGTPSDCVNIALSHLLPKKPDMVVSGINIGCNLGTPLILSSGTLAGAIEAAGWGLPAMAFSQQVNGSEQYAILRRKQGYCEGAQAVSLRAAAAHATRLALEEIERAVVTEQRPLCVHNVNFPLETKPDTPVRATQLTYQPLGSLFEASGEGRYTFKFHAHDLPDKHEHSDIHTVFSGNISFTTLDFQSLSRASAKT